VQNNAGVKENQGMELISCGRRGKGLTLLLFRVPKRKAFSPMRSEDSRREEERISYVLSRAGGSRAARQGILHTLYESNVHCRVQKIPRDLYQCNPHLHVLLTQDFVIALKYSSFISSV
jgi:hypothetical protein